MPVFSREKVGISRRYDRVSGERLSSELLIIVLLEPAEVAVAAVVVVVEIDGAAAPLSVSGSDINHYYIPSCTHYLGAELSHSSPAGRIYVRRPRPCKITATTAMSSVAAMKLLPLGPHRR